MKRDELETEREREGRGAERQLHPIFSPELLKDLRGCGKWIKEKLKSKTFTNWNPWYCSLTAPVCG